MSTPAPSWDTTRCHGTWHTMTGALRPGAFKVTLTDRVTNTPSDAIVPAGVFASGRLATTGATSLDLLVPVVDDPDNSTPTSMRVVVDVAFDEPGVKGERFVLAPVRGVEINLRTVSPDGALSPAQVASLILGAAGGVALLDADGDVIDATGAKVVAGPGGGLDEEALSEWVDDSLDDGALHTALAAKADAGATTTALAGKADAAAVASALAGKAATSHAHAQGDVTGLTAALSAKADAATVTAALATKRTVADERDVHLEWTGSAWPAEPGGLGAGQVLHFHAEWAVAATLPSPTHPRCLLWLHPESPWLVT
ncbi:hypothetical protein [Cellulomonas composti]|uniref:Uncharacterized protein n=1 Tax=Cellulomonas composti TaxID=266130 RepID=A0A511JBI5_9CELL|nr:hypothetical protein [Cellulomonas composti]GEL95346.1 hypothetical protein CCO02nite_20040 [Cellulomonas composti]